MLESVALRLERLAATLPFVQLVAQLLNFVVFDLDNAAGVQRPNVVGHGFGATHGTKHPVLGVILLIEPLVDARLAKQVATLERDQAMGAALFPGLVADGARRAVAIIFFFIDPERENELVTSLLLKS